MKTLISLLLALLISSCSQKNNLNYAERDNAYIQYINDNSLTDVKRINRFRFDGWLSLSRKYLIISSHIKRKYLIELIRNCDDLAFEQTLMLQQTTSGSLHARFDSISVTDTLNQPGCLIQAIYPLTVEQAKEIANIGYPTNDASNTTNADS